MLGDCVSVKELGDKTLVSTCDILSFIYAAVKEKHVEKKLEIAVHSNWRNGSWTTSHFPTDSSIIAEVFIRIFNLELLGHLDSSPVGCDVWSGGRTAWPASHSK